MRKLRVVDEIFDSHNETTCGGLVFIVYVSNFEFEHIYDCDFIGFHGVRTEMCTLCLSRDCVE